MKLDSRPLLVSATLRTLSRVAAVWAATGTLTLALNAAPVWDDDIRTVVITGTQIPGEPSGVFMSLAPWNPSLNDTGQVAFRTILAGPGVNTNNAVANDIAILRGDPDGNLRTVARQRGALAGAPNKQYRWLQDPLINKEGTTTFGAIIVNTGSQSPTEDAFFRQVDASPPQVVLHQHPSIFVDSLSADDQGTSGLLTMRAQLAPQQVGGYSDAGIVRETTPGQFLELARTNKPAPGAGATTVFRAFNPPTLSPSDLTAFHAYLKQPGESDAAPYADSGVFREVADGSVKLVARWGESISAQTAVPRFFGFDSVSIGRANRVAFSAAFADDPNDPAFDVGLFRETANGGLEVIARTGDTLHLGDGSELGTIQTLYPLSVAFNEHNRAALIAHVTNTGPPSFGDVIAKEGTSGGLAVIAAAGQPVPGLGGNIAFQGFIGGTVINRNGQVAFEAFLEGPGVNATNNTAIFAEDRHGRVTMIARRGDFLDVNDDTLSTDLRRIEGLSFLPNDLSEREHSPFNARGEYAFAASFTDGTSGMFISTAAAIPEPAAAILMVFAVCQFAACRVQSPAL